MADTHDAMPPKARVSGLDGTRAASQVENTSHAPFLVSEMCSSCWVGFHITLTYGYHLAIGGLLIIAEHQARKGIIKLAVLTDPITT